MGVRVGNGSGFDFGSQGAAKTMKPMRGFMPQSHQRGAKVPLVENPFEIAGGLALSLMKVINEYGDYLECYGFDHNAKNPGGAFSPASHRKFFVAKPTLLMKSPWDGATIQSSVDGAATDVVYSYTGINTRTATATINGEEVTETQRITPDYFHSDEIVVARLKKNRGYDGIRTPTASGARIEFMDLNVSGRCWAVEDLF